MSSTPLNALEQAAAALPPISLEEMDAVKLMNRVDTKYLTSEETLLKVLEDALKGGYRALEVGGDKVAGYLTVYYDTPEQQMYLNHHNRRLVRQKVRTRVYMNSGDTYLEIKRKNNHGRTKKKRIGIAENELGDFSHDAFATDYLAGHSAYTAEDISPALSTEFRRITLVNPGKTERLTIDTSVHFQNIRNGRKSDLQDAVIIELKQDGRASSTMKGILLDHRVKPLRISKYCIGTTLTDSDIKHNRFKEKVRAIEKVIGKKFSTPETTIDNIDDKH
jgi:hypothetical protein